MKNIDILDISNDKKSYNGAKNIEAVLNILKNPQDNLNIIHVAGTNGKGSVCNFIANALEENGYKVGLYTSPAIFDNTDRFKINHENINDKRLFKYYEDIKKLCKEHSIEINEFDIATVIAFLYFYEQDCDFAVVEVGIGGRVDSTNVIKRSLVSVILNIGFDHMDLLGDTLEDIAYEKSGIIKNNSTVVYYPQEDSINKIIEDQARIKNSQIIKPDFSKIKDINVSKDILKFKYKGYNFDLLLKSHIQKFNSVIAFEVINKVKEKGFNISLDKAVRGINSTYIPGRFEKMRTKPDVIVDGSHNEKAVLSLKNTLKKIYPNEKLVFIIGFYKDKEYEKLIQLTSELAYCYICCESGSKRSLNSKTLFEISNKYSNMVYDKKTIENSIEFALDKFKDRNIVIYGSLSLVSKVSKYFNKE
ncbi:MAG: folylpolyglutamate synthase/dihydrofolate synthase family protein [Lagierella massiliensis]|nr:folylpolyglutamate synthase/dihydrofolate synthase family protein [Lagierella massiliensis]